MRFARQLALTFGVVYLVVGVLGFIPALSAGTAPAGGANLLGIFPINWLHNLVHLGIGAALVLAATGTRQATLTARVVGIVYLAVGLLGFVSPDMFGLMPIGDADIALHLVSGGLLLFVIGYGVALNPQPST